jgi:H+/Cl- antiporter ClcA
MALTLAPRHIRRARVISTRWQKRALFLIGGLIVGGCAVGFAVVADLAQDGFRWLLSFSSYLPLLITPLGLAVSVYAARRWFPNSGGSGIPQAIAARELTDQAARGRLVSLWVAGGKIMLTLLGLLCGAAIGREGPTVQVGASVMFALGKLSPRRQSGLILAGAAAGVAAAFNTPLAGIVFAVEEMSRSFEQRTSGLIISTVIAGGLVSLAILGNYAYFGTTVMALHGSQPWLAVGLCGVVGGALGGCFSWLVVAAAGRKGVLWETLRRHPVLSAAGFGLGVAVCGLLSHDSIYGTGYAQVEAMLSGQTPPPLSFGVLKLIASLFSAASGAPGGIFSPSLAVGAGIGQDIGQLLPNVPLGTIALLGMVGYFSGVVQAPITAFVIVTEMTHGETVVVPLMITSLIGFAVSRLICGEGIYHALSHNFIRAAQASDHP